MSQSILDIANYPRPLMKRPNWMSLDGPWDFAFISEPQFQNPQLLNLDQLHRMTIQVPYSYHTKQSLIHDESYHPHLWYRKLVSVSIKPNQTLYLHFEAVDYHAKVYVNSQYVGSHEGGYNRFSFDITPFVKREEIEIEVFVEDTLSREQPRGKQRYKNENFECWYIETSGIWKTAWMEIVEHTHIKNVEYVYSSTMFTLQLNLQAMTDEDILQVEIIDSNKQAICSYLGIPKTQVELSLPSDIKLWSAENPYLYDIVVTLWKNHQVVDQVFSYVGFRFLSWNQEYCINGTPLYLKMILDQGYFDTKHLTCTVDDLYKDLFLIQSMGLNGIRKHEKIEDQRFNYLCDVLGIYTWQEMPSFYQYTEQSKRRLKTEWTEVIHQYKLHPSIIAWVPFNESWGIFDVMHDISQQKYTEKIVFLTKELDSTRPVVSNDGWEHTVSDLVTLHNYAEYGETLLQTYQDMKKVLSNEEVHPKPPRLAFCERYQYHSQPILLTEFAGIAFEGKDGWGYGRSVQSADEFIKRLKSLVDAIYQIPRFQGYCVTQLTDVQQEKNGLLYENREPKVPLDDMKRIF